MTTQSGKPTCSHYRSFTFQSYSSWLVSLPSGLRLIIGQMEAGTSAAPEASPGCLGVEPIIKLENCKLISQGAEAVSQHHVFQHPCLMFNATHAVLACRTFKPPCPARPCHSFLGRSEFGRRRFSAGQQSSSSASTRNTAILCWISSSQQRGSSR